MTMQQRGNARPVRRDNRLVHAIAELMDVVRDLCRYASAFRVAGKEAWSEALTEQCADLLLHRARIFAGLLRDGGVTIRAGRAGSSGGTEWMN
jgi:hypothetical protein